MDLIIDLETGDPDDALALAWVANHPRIQLRAVTVMPGSRTQIGIVREVLRRCGLEGVAVGSRSPERGVEAVPGFYRQWLGETRPAEADGVGHEVLAEALIAYPDAALLTCAPLHNLRLLLERHPLVTIQRWVAQGGYAGNDVVPPAHRLKKFEGRLACPSWNFDGDVRGARAALASTRIATRQLVSKNVCHGIVYGMRGRDRLLSATGLSAGQVLLRDGLTIIEARRGLGNKGLHDLLAAAVVVDPSVVDFREVGLARGPDGWRAELRPGSGTWITVHANRDRFWDVIVEPQVPRS